MLTVAGCYAHERTRRRASRVSPPLAADSCCRDRIWFQRDCFGDYRAVHGATGQGIRVGQGDAIVRRIDYRVTDFCDVTFFRNAHRPLGDALDGAHRDRVCEPCNFELQHGQRFPVTMDDALGNLRLCRGYDQIDRMDGRNFQRVS